MLGAAEIATLRNGSSVRSGARGGGGARTGCLPRSRPPSRATSIRRRSRCCPSPRRVVVLHRAARAERAAIAALGSIVMLEAPGPCASTSSRRAGGRSRAGDLRPARRPPRRGAHRVRRLRVRARGRVEPALVGVRARIAARAGGRACTAWGRGAPDRRGAGVRRRHGRRAARPHRGPPRRAAQSAAAAAGPGPRRALPRRGQHAARALRGRRGARGRADPRGRDREIVLACEVQVDVPAVHDVAAVYGVLREDFPSCFCFCAGRGEDAFIAASPELFDPPRRDARVDARARRLDAPQRRPLRRRPPRRAAAALGQEPRRAADRRAPDRAGAAALQRCMYSAPEPGIVRWRTSSTSRARSARSCASRSARCASRGRQPRRRRSAASRAVAEPPIPALEGTHRGWYAGPVGWTDTNEDGGSCVALRCALLSGRIARCYAGVGASDSIPAAEWPRPTSSWGAASCPRAEALHERSMFATRARG